MHALDIVFFVIAVTFVIIGIRRGLIGEIVRLLAMIAGFFAAFFYYREIWAGVSFLRHFPPPAGPAVTFLLIYIITVLLILGAGWIIKQVVKLTPFGIFDKIFGGAIGFIKAALIAWVVCLSISTFPAHQQDRNLHNSLVWKAYLNSPSWLHWDALSRVRKYMKKTIEKDTPKQIDAMKDRIETLKAKVDSVKGIP